MLPKIICVCLIFISTLQYINGQIQHDKRSRAQWFRARELHDGFSLSDFELERLSGLAGDMTLFKSLLNPIMVERIVGTPGHADVRKHIVDTLRPLHWDVEEDAFDDQTPNGRKTFTNVIATLDPDAPRHLVLACHYDSKIDTRGTFIGATDSAVPCAMLLHLAVQLREYLQVQKRKYVRARKRKKNERRKKGRRRRIEGMRERGRGEGRRRGGREGGGRGGGRTRQNLKPKSCSRQNRKRFWRQMRKRKQTKIIFCRTKRSPRCRTCDDETNPSEASTLDSLVNGNMSGITEITRPLRCFGRAVCVKADNDEFRFKFFPNVNADLSLKLIFFDGEEAFVSWTKTDSLYGSRKLAQRLSKQLYPPGNELRTNHLHRMDILVLLDLLGTKDMQFYNYFENTERWYARMVTYERKLDDLGLLNNIPFMFRAHNTFNAGIQDDHIPFLKRGVPVLHIIPVPFPKVWHTLRDNESALHYPTIDNFNRILFAFTADYLHIDMSP